MEEETGEVVKKVKTNLAVKDVAFNSTTAIHTKINYTEPSTSARFVMKCKRLKT